jgi:hypothetical protein
MENVWSALQRDYIMVFDHIRKRPVAFLATATVGFITAFVLIARSRSSKHIKHNDLRTPFGILLINVCSTSAQHDPTFYKR